MVISTSNAVILILLAAVCGVIGQSIRMAIGIIKEYTNSLKHKNDKFEQCLSTRLDQINDRIPQVENDADQSVYAALLAESLTIQHLQARHRLLYNIWDISYYDWRRFGVGWAISIFIGAFAGIFYVFSGLVNNVDVITGFNVVSSLVAGYVGTDVIEGFMKKNKMTIPTSMEKTK